MTTNFFRQRRRQVVESPPTDTDLQAPQRTRFTTEEYWNGLTVPTSLVLNPGVHIEELHQTYSGNADAHLVQTKLPDAEGRIQTVAHVVVSGVKS